MNTRAVDAPNICVAEVRDSADITRSGIIKVCIKEGAISSEDLVDVNYVSPYGSNSYGGFVAIPEKGTEVLICKPYGSAEWFYMGTTFRPEAKFKFDSVSPDKTVPPISRPDPKLYSKYPIPERYFFKSATGAGLTIAENTDLAAMNKYVELKSGSSKAKKIKLDDTPSKDHILLDTGNDASIEITSVPELPSSKPSRAILVESQGPQKYINNGSQTDMVVTTGGKELQIVNSANGILNGVPNWPIPIRVAGGLGVVSPIRPNGNINIQSTNRDVNVFTKSTSGRIFIECLNPAGVNQQIVIETNGVGGGIVIKTNGKVSVEALQGIDMCTAGSINMSCTSYNLTCANMNVAALATMNLDAPLINLAPPVPVVPALPMASLPLTAPLCIPKPSAQRDILETSDYGNLGILNWE